MAKGAIAQTKILEKLRKNLFALGFSVSLN
jgi:hypothetical protein